MFYVKKKETKKNIGAVAILTVIIVSVAGLIMAVGASRMGLGDLLGAYVEQKGNETYSVAEGCAEEALHQLTASSTYSGTGGIPLALGNGTCTIGVTGNNITVVGTVGTYVRTFTVNFTLTGTTITINSWVEN